MKNFGAAPRRPASDLKWWDQTRASGGGVDVTHSGIACLLDPQDMVEEELNLEERSRQVANEGSSEGGWRCGGSLKSGGGDRNFL